MQLLQRQLLDRIEQDYADALSDEYLAQRVGQQKLRWSAGIENFYLEVDHIEPICKGGDMWDEKNLQTICNFCHKKKTKEDVKK